jgi:hypothetical protein
MTVTVPHPLNDDLRTGRQPHEAVGHAGVACAAPPPLLGQHTDEVLHPLFAGIQLVTVATTLAFSRFRAHTGTRAHQARGT